TVVPYYLLIVGSPQEIPFEFQYQLDVNYAVGRIDFDTPEEYRNYVQSVVKAETDNVYRPNSFVMFAPTNQDDRATQLSNDELAVRVQEQLVADRPDWRVSYISGEEATKKQLELYLGGKDTPTLIFFTGHGVPFSMGDEHQIPYQGALLSQDWPGPKEWKGPIPSDFYFSGEDVHSEADLHGLIAVLSGSYSAGTPAYDNFPSPGMATAKPMAPFDFVAQLPKRLLSHPNGGALAVIGKVDRMWSTAFRWKDTRTGYRVYTDMLLRLIKGYPVGAAMEPINQRHAELASEMSRIARNSHFGIEVESINVSSMWTAYTDSRNWIVIGDPAVQLMVDGLEPPIDSRLKQFRAQILMEEARNLVFEADIPGALEKYASALAFDSSLKIHPSAEIERLIPEAVQTLLEVGRSTARSGKWEDAVIQFKKALTLDPSLALNLETEAKTLTAQAFSEQAANLAETGVITEAIIKFEAALQLNPTLDISPLQDAVTIGVPVLIEQARSFAEQGDIQNSRLKFKEAIRWDPSLNINPEQELRDLAVPVLIEQGRSYAQNINIISATLKFAEAITIEPNLGIIPEQEAKQIAAQVLVSDAYDLARNQKIAEAAATFE
ncbi:MAG: tetratricopeptide repeat protein, partial [Hyphomicrobiaceae bacterium]|nr:tetratricopeptide repeat protein [Hyphomicrobiaceae bacterium]